MPRQSKSAMKLKRLRERAGLTVRATAQAIGREPSTYAWYEDGYKKEHLPVELVKSLIPVLCKKGVSPRELLQLAGINSQETDSSIPISVKDMPSISIQEIDVKGGAGLGGESLLENLTDEAGNVHCSDVTKGNWNFPPDYLAEVRVKPNQVRIIEITGDSMTSLDGGGLHSGDRVMIDISDTNPSPPGIFALWDGFGVVVKRVERIPGSDPASLRLLSDNPAHAPYEVSSTEANIIGRVCWFARRL